MPARRSRHAGISLRLGAVNIRLKAPGLGKGASRRQFTQSPNIGCDRQASTKSNGQLRNSCVCAGQRTSYSIGS
jgi:hypothetical protein